MRITKKVVIASAAVVVIGAGTAFAFWTNTGSGEGSATTGTNVAITVNQTSTSDVALVPGGPVQPLSGTFTNTNSSPVFVDHVTVSITAGFSVRPDASKPACTSADYTLVQPTATNAQVTTDSPWAGASIALINRATNQDNCKGAVVPLTYTSN
jgi:hypothetical protein